MKAIDFTKYPNILPYVEKNLNKDYFKPWSYNPMTEETFINIVSHWIEQYEKHIDVIVQNTLEIYDLTAGETGYKALGADWKRRREVFKIEHKFDEKIVREWWFDKFTAIISHLYQRMTSGFDDYRSGATGCLITASFNISWVDSDYKGVEKIAVASINLHLDIGLNDHYEVDQHEY